MFVPEPSDLCPFSEEFARQERDWLRQELLLERRARVFWQREADEMASWCGHWIEDQSITETMRSSIGGVCARHQLAVRRRWKDETTPIAGGVTAGGGTRSAPTRDTVDSPSGVTAKRRKSA